MVNRKRMKAFNTIVRNSLFWFTSEIFCQLKTFGLWSLFVVFTKFYISPILVFRTSKWKAIFMLFVLCFLLQKHGARRKASSHEVVMAKLI